VVRNGELPFRCVEATAADYGQVRRIGSSGNVVRFLYDVWSRRRSYSLDGRRLVYGTSTVTW
jgi:hypothetical protein